MLKLHSFEPRTRGNGPGMRACVWLQGCTLACAGCFNPETHTQWSGESYPASQVASWIIEQGPSIEGVTISGGEPLQQWEGLRDLLGLLSDVPRLSVVLFTGFAIEEVRRMGRLNYLRSRVDVLIAGRYDAQQRLAQGLRGSGNKTYSYFSERYSDVDMRGVPVAEVLIEPNGNVVLTGIDPLRW